MTPFSLLLALLFACGGADPVADGSADADVATPEAEAPGPPEGFACPEGTTQVGGGVDVMEEHWHTAEVPWPSASPAQCPDEEGWLGSKALVPAMDEGTLAWACTREDGSLHGPYYATLSGGLGTVEGQFTDGKPTGEWLGLWTVLEEEAGAADAPDEEAPAEEAPAEGGEEGADGSEEATEGSEPSEGSEEPAEGADGDAEEEGPTLPELETKEGTTLMFRGAYTDAGEKAGKWFAGGEPGSGLDLRFRGMFDEAGAMVGLWAWYDSEDQWMAQYFAEGEPTGRHTHAKEGTVTKGSFARGKRAGRWVTKNEGGEVIDQQVHQGTVRRTSAKKRADARR